MPPYGGNARLGYLSLAGDEVSSHAPVWGQHDVYVSQAGSDDVSSHAPVWGQLGICVNIKGYILFQVMPPYGGNS